MLPLSRLQQLDPVLYGSTSHTANMNIMINMMLSILCFISALSAAAGAETEPPQPYSFSYKAGRAPGHVDRIHAEVSDGNGVVRGMFSYVDPRQTVRTVEYVADQNGFQPLYISNPNTDTQAVTQEKAKHAALYHRIALEQQRIAEERGQFGLDDGSYKPQPDEEIQHVIVPINHPKDTAAVNRAKFRHFDLYEKIAQDHARIAAERQIQNPDPEA